VRVEGPGVSEDRSGVKICEATLGRDP